MKHIMVSECSTSRCSMLLSLAERYIPRGIHLIVLSTCWTKPAPGDESYSIVGPKSSTHLNQEANTLLGEVQALEKRKFL